MRDEERHVSAVPANMFVFGESGLNQNMQNSESWHFSFLFVCFVFSVLGAKCWLFSKLIVWEHRESHVCEGRGGEERGLMNGARFRISCFSHSNILFKKTKKEKT